MPHSLPMAPHPPALAPLSAFCFYERESSKDFVYVEPGSPRPFVTGSFLLAQCPRGSPRRGLGLNVLPFEGCKLLPVWRDHWAHPSSVGGHVGVPTVHAVVLKPGREPIPPSGGREFTARGQVTPTSLSGSGCVSPWSQAPGHRRLGQPVFLLPPELSPWGASGCSHH